MNAVIQPPRSPRFREEAMRIGGERVSGADSCISEFSVAGFYLLGALSENNKNPERASRPFDLRRNGFVLAEGAGILIVEELHHALAAEVHPSWQN